METQTKTELGMDYKAATILFPEFYDDRIHTFEENPGTISSDVVSFTRNGNTIEAHISPFHLPRFLSDHPEVQKQIVKPMVERITKDIESIDCFFDELRGFAREGRVNDTMYFERDMFSQKPGFKVFDYSRIENGYPFTRLLDLKTVHPTLIREDYREFHKMASWVKEGDKLAYVEGNSLREAVERAMTIYRASEKLRELKPFGF